jgi:hypothetical protein
MKNRLNIFILFLIIITITTNTHAQTTTEKISIHGFGGWAYAKTNGNLYSIGNHEGNYNHFEFALNIAAYPIENLSIHAQPTWETQTNILLADVDYVFANWHFSDALNLRIGKVKSPFGLYSEIYHVGTLRPFIILPQSNYGSPGIVQKSYNGIGITGLRYIKNDWGIEYDIYAGQMELEPMRADRFSVNPGYEGVILNVFFSKIIGGRITTILPIDGLSFSMAGTFGDMQFKDQGEEIEDFPITDKHYIYSLNLEYMSYRWWFRGEYLNFDRYNGADIEINCAYAETAFRFLKKWQITALYDWLEVTNKMDEFPLPDHVLPLLNHEEWAFGLNYWFSPNFVLKCSYHFIEGNVFADPGRSMVQVFFGADYKKKTELILFGAHFSF